MSDRDGVPGPSSSAEDTELSGRLRDLSRQLGEHREDPIEDVPKESGSRNPSIAMAMRAASDFVAGIIVGAALGWGFDQLFDTSPWGLIVFFLFGFAAGLLNVMRTAGPVRPRTGGEDREVK